MAHFVSPTIQANETGWGPSSVPEKYKDMPYQPFSKGDRLGKVSSFWWNSCQTGPVKHTVEMWETGLWNWCDLTYSRGVSACRNGSYSGLAGPWNRGIIAHQTPHFRRPPKHVNNKGPLVFAQTFCTAWFISLENLHIYSKTYVFSNIFEGFRPKCTFRGCFNKYRRTFIVYMFRRPPEVWSLMSDNALISGTGKVGMAFYLLHHDLCPVDSCVNLHSALDSRNGVMSMRTSPHLRALLTNNNPCGQQFS